MRYPATEKERLVALYHHGTSISDLTMQTGIPRSTLYSWVKLYTTSITESGNHFTAAEFCKMQKRVAKLEAIVEVLRKVHCNMDSPLQEKLYELEKLYGQYSVYTLCEALGVSRGTFYNHVLRNKKQNKSYQARRDMLSEQIKEIYDKSNQVFGAKKIKFILEGQGVRTSVKMVSRLMNEMNLTSVRLDAKKHYDQTRSKRKDLLNASFSATAPNQVWVSDVTCFRLDETRYYICAIIDLYARKVIAHKISKKQSAQLIASAFKAAYTLRRPSNQLIFHSDRGSQYTAYSFQKRLETLGVEHSFSPSGKPHHNAVMESFFSNLKKEELYRYHYRSEVEFRKSVEKYILFYNTERPHAAIQYKIPNAYESAFWQNHIDTELEKGGSKVVTSSI